MVLREKKGVRKGDVKGKMRPSGELEGKMETGIDGSKCEGEPDRDPCLLRWFISSRCVCVFIEQGDGNR